MRERDLKLAEVRKRTTGALAPLKTIERTRGALAPLSLIENMADGPLGKVAKDVRLPELSALARASSALARKLAPILRMPASLQRLHQAGLSHDAIAWAEAHPNATPAAPSSVNLLPDLAHEIAKELSDANTAVKGDAELSADPRYARELRLNAERERLRDLQREYTRFPSNPMNEVRVVNVLIQKGRSHEAVNIMKWSHGSTPAHGDLEAKTNLIAGNYRNLIHGYQHNVIYYVGSGGMSREGIWTYFRALVLNRDQYFGLDHDRERIINCPGAWAAFGPVLEFLESHPPSGIPNLSGQGWDNLQAICSNLEPGERAEVYAYFGYAKEALSELVTINRRFGREAAWLLVQSPMFNQLRDQPLWQEALREQGIAPEFPDVPFEIA